LRRKHFVTLWLAPRAAGLPTVPQVKIVLVLPLALIAGCSSHGGAAVPTTIPPRVDVVPLARTAGAVAKVGWSAWPEAGFDGQRSGTSPTAGPTTGRLRWTRKLEGNVTPGPVIGVDGTIIAASNQGVLHGLDPRTGQDLWSFDAHGSYGSDLSTSSAVLPDGTILWPGPHDTLFALDEKGTLLWQQTFPAQPTSPAVSADGATVVLGDRGGGVTALHVSGAQRVAGTSLGSVALAPSDPSTAYDTIDYSLFAVHAGKILWKISTGDEIEVSPAVAPDGTIVVGSNDEYEYGVHPDGRLAWKYLKTAQTYSSPVVAPDGIAWFGDHRAYVEGVQASTGKLVARYRGEAVQPAHGPSVGVWTSVLLDSSHNTYWGTRLGHVYGEAPSGKRLFDITTGATVDSYPALDAHGLLVVGVTDGRLLGISDR
jgi:outer membrane protein assembly factor BamB